MTEQTQGSNNQQTTQQLSTISHNVEQCAHEYEVSNEEFNCLSHMCHAFEAINAHGDW